MWICVACYSVGVCFIVYVCWLWVGFVIGLLFIVYLFYGAIVFA